MELRGVGNGNERHKLAVGGRLSERHHNRENSRHIRKPAASRMGRRAKPYRQVGKVAFQLRRHQRLPASPKIFVRGTIKGFCRKGEAGGIIEGEDGAEAQYLSWANAPESVKLEIDTLLRMIYTITQTPDISFDTVKGLGAISGVALQLLFMDAHLKVQDKNEIFSEYLQRRINVLKAYMAEANINWRTAASSLIVEPEITPYIIEDELSKINILQAANGQKQIASRKATIQRLGWADNADEEEAAIEAEETRERSYYQGEPTL